MQRTITFNINEFLALIGFWGIFTKHGVAGWKAIIPCYRELLWGRIVNREDLGKKAMYLGIAAIILGFAFSMLVVLAGVQAGMTPEMLVQGAEQSTTLNLNPKDISPALLIAIGVVTLALLIIVVYSIYIYYNLGKAHTEMEHAPSWWKWIWLFFRGIAAVYFGFIYKNPETVEEIH